jgi:biopolymer transport protein ExbB/biopolymer transport protein TolQ
MHLDLITLWGTMGWFAKGIVFVLAIMSIWSLTVMITKAISFGRTQRATRVFAPQFSRAIQEENLDQAISLAEKNKKSHLARVVGEALAEVKPLLRDRATITAADINSAERAVERQMLIVLSELKRGTGILATVGATAPFVGLLGTTMGIVNAFTGMAASGSGGLSAISAGIAEALITTAFGLMVAIPAVWMFNYFSTKIDNLTAEMTYTSKEMIDYLIKGVSGEFGRSRFTREFNTAGGSSGPINT